jgi:uncharacterized protein YcbK (DUF882 family)
VNLLVSALVAVVGPLTLATTVGPDVTLPTSQQLASKKGGMGVLAGEEEPLVLGTLVLTHTGEHLLLDEGSPSQERFDALLADRVTWQRHAIDTRLLDMLRRLTHDHLGARIEIVSGYRSEKLNEMLRKKGHHVASHSQHSLGHAVDFRLIEPTYWREGRGIDPRTIELELRHMGWDGGVGVYISDSDWFTHADVGPNRRWNGQ